jgi:hypothetical protein
MHSLLGMKGYNAHTNAHVEIIERDSYGRILFEYYEDYYGGPTSGIPDVFCYLICQMSNKQHVYFYEDVNLIIKQWDEGNGFFSEEEIAAFKEMNDWGKELDESKCVKYEIERLISNPTVPIEIELIEEIFESKKLDEQRREPKARVSTHARYLASDAYGRILYDIYRNHVVVHERENPSRHTTAYYFVGIFNPDGSYNEDTCIMELEDLYAYQDELKAFKDQNGWNTPWE